MRQLPAFNTLQSFVKFLDQEGQLVRVKRPVSVALEITEIHRRVLARHGPALLFENPTGPTGSPYSMPILVNLFGTVDRIAFGLGITKGNLPALGEALAELRQPSPPHNLAQAYKKAPLLKMAMSMGMRQTRTGKGDYRCQLHDDVDLTALPIQHCWPDEPAPLVTWPLVITRSPNDASDINVGVYRMQVLGSRTVIIRWLNNRGGAKHFRQWQEMGLDMPVAVAVGADPATILAAVLPIPETVNELSFSGLLRGAKASVIPGLTVEMPIPASSEIILEGFISHRLTAPEGPYGDHTGYYNGVEDFPLTTLSALRVRNAQPIYLSTFTGRPPDEPSRLGETLNVLFLPIIKRQFPEIVDIWFPPEACSYRAMVVSIRKRYEGQAKRIMMGLWSALPQFNYCKFIIVVDPDIRVESWTDVVWAITTRFEAPRDLTVIENTPIDYLDFSSVRKGLGTKLGFDATHKIGSETDREWGKPLTMSPEIVDRINRIWGELGLPETRGL